MRGQLSKTQSAGLRGHVQGKKVYDLGSGTGELSFELVDLGAASVVAVDKENYNVKSTAQITVVRQYFRDFHVGLIEDPEVVFLSWPANRFDEGLLSIVRRAAVVIYLGKNTDGTMCGWPGLFNHFVQRQLLLYLPDRTNTLIVLGSVVGERLPRGEERAGIDIYSSRTWYTYDQVESPMREPGSEPDI